MACYVSAINCQLLCMTFLNKARSFLLKKGKRLEASNSGCISDDQEENISSSEHNNTGGSMRANVKQL